MKNEILNLPLKNRDIKARVTRRYIVSIIITAVWCVTVFIVVTVYRVGSSSITGGAFLIATIAIPVLMLKPYRIIFDRSWTGVVKSTVRKNRPIKVVTSRASIGSVYNSHHYPGNLDITLIIECSNGKTIKKKHRLKGLQSLYADIFQAYYNTDTVVNCYRGVKYLKKENNAVKINNISHRLCIMCGNFGVPEQTKCRRCRSTFVD